MQRVGRRGHAQFRMIVQDKRFHPTSGRVVAYLGNFNPHTKQSNFDKDQLMSYLTNGAQPSPRVIKLLKTQKITLPEWIVEPAPKKKAVRNPDKRRSTRPEGAPEPETAKAEKEEPVKEEPTKTDSSQTEAEAPKEVVETQADAEPESEESASTDEKKAEPEPIEEAEASAEK